MATKKAMAVQAQCRYLQRELATAIKNDVLNKIKPETLYRSRGNRKFFRLQDNGNDVLVVLNTAKAYDTEFEQALRELIEDSLVIENICLSTGCWGKTESPVGSVRKSSADKLQKYLNVVADRMCDKVRKATQDVYANFATQADMLHGLKNDK